MDIGSTVMVVLTFLWELLKAWGELFFISFTNWQTIWIIVPIWLSWFFAEFFQEKKGTSFGNAISNGVVPFWVGIDWLRSITMQMIDEKVKFSSLIFGKYAIAVLALIYGFMIILFGIKGKGFIRYFGRIREVTYVLVMVTPFVYGFIQFDLKYILAAVLFFPVFYLVIEIIDRLTPEPQSLSKDEGMEQAERDKALEFERELPSFDEPSFGSPGRGGFPPSQGSFDSVPKYPR